MIKIGQIGIGHNHGDAKMLAVRKFPELFQVIGFSEDDERVFNERSTRRAYDGLKRLSTEEIIEECDAILVETEVPRLTEYAQKCVERGKHIHLDKPGSTDTMEYKKMLDTAKKNGCIVQLGYMYRYNNGVKRAMELYKSGALGEITMINAEMSTYHGAEYKKWLSTFQGGIMYILGSHLIDLAVYFLGEPKKITSFFKHSLLDGVDFPDNDLAILEYDRAIARIFASSVEVNGWGRRQLFISGTKGSIDIKPIENDIVVYEAFSKDCTHSYSDMKVRADIKDIHKDSRYDEMMTDFYEYVKGTKENPFSYEHELLVQKTINKVIEGDKK
jgi:predicted dehydrogenase